MRVICVVDNTVKLASQLWAEHGLAFLVETEGRRVLFDTGQSGTVLLHNLEVLNVEPTTIDAVVLSHAHNDHTGGVSKLMKFTRPGIPIFAHTDIFRERFSKKGGEIHNKTFSTTRQVLEEQFDLRLNDKPEEIIPSVWTTGGITDRTEPEGRSADHLMREGGELITDAYKDDIGLVLQIGDRLMVLCGCCHAGLLNTLAHVERSFHSPVAFIAGGLHLSAATIEEQHHVGDVLNSKSILLGVYPSHCTGEAAYVTLTNILGSSVVQLCPAGTILELKV